MQYQALNPAEEELRLLTLDDPEQMSISKRILRLWDKHSSGPRMWRMDHFSLRAREKMEQLEYWCEVEPIADSGEIAPGWMERQYGLDQRAAQQSLAELQTLPPTNHSHPSGLEYRDEVYNERNARFTWGDYVALSYTWGPEGDSKEICMNGQPINVRANLAAALDQIQHTPEIKSGLKLWVDAICINQDDVAERNAEVKHMRAIYGQAWNVLVWLGNETEDSGEAIKLIEWLHSCIGTVKNTAEFLSILRDLHEAFDDGPWMALRQFLTRPYWTRIWVIQELAMRQRDAILLCGKRRLRLGMVCDVVDFLFHNFDNPFSHFFRMRDDPGQDDVAQLNELMHVLARIHQLRRLAPMMKRSHSYLTVNAVLMLSQTGKETDPKDKVYAVLGLLDPKISALVEPNYELSIKNIFRDFAKAIIQATGSLNIIYRGGQFGRVEQWPTWVPDWRLRHDRNVYIAGQGTTKASRGTSPQFRYPKNEFQLVCKGFIFDEVDGAAIPSPRAGEEELNNDFMLTQPTSSTLHYTEDASISDALTESILDGRQSQLSIRGDVINGLPVLALTQRCLPSPFLLPWDFFPACAEILEGTPETMNSDWFKIYRSRWASTFDAFRRRNESFRINGRNLKDYFSYTMESIEDPDQLLEAIELSTKIMLGRRLITTKNGYIGNAVEISGHGDKVGILLGCDRPVILRPYGLAYQVIGDCYIHSIMEGEAMELLRNGDYQLDDITLS